MPVAALLVAGGSGQRFGGETPKQFRDLAGKPVIRHAAEALARPPVDLLQPVGDAVAIAAALAGIGHLRPVPGGATRQDSVRAGLEALVPHRPEIVLVHDAARPIIPEGLVPALVREVAAGHPGAIPALPISDTLKEIEDDQVRRTVPRAALARAQTPQAFDFETLLALHRSPAHAGATDDAWLLEQAEFLVATVPGSERNIKITYPEDLTRAELFLSMTGAPRVGTGFDVHAFADGRPLILCGIPIPAPRGLAGHSDADVGIHALCDALYGALAEGDIGRHFPPGDESWRDADSARFLRHAAERVSARGGRIVNADVTLICEQPKIAPHAPAMRARLAGLMEIDESRVSVKATSTEKLGFAGRGEGIAAQAAVSILLPD